MVGVQRGPSIAHSGLTGRNKTRGMKERSLEVEKQERGATHGCIGHVRLKKGVVHPSGEEKVMEGQ